MTPEQAKQLVAEAAVQYIERDWVVGVEKHQLIACVVMALKFTN